MATKKANQKAAPKAAGKQVAPRTLTALDIRRGGGFKSVEIEGMFEDGAPGIIHYKPLSARKVLEYMDRENDPDLSDREKFDQAVKDLTNSLVTPEGEPLVEEEDLMEAPVELVTQIMQAIANVKVEGGPEGNGSDAAEEAGG